MILDDLIGLFSPRAKYRRIQYRQASTVLQRKYEGATRGRRTANWQTPSTSVNAENQYAIEILRNRSRDLVRNNPHAQRAVSVIANNVVGKGIIPNIVSPKGEAQSEKLQKLWETWAENPKFFDFDGKHDFYSLQSLVMRSTVESGEILIRRRVSSNPDLPIPFQIQVLESDHLPLDRVSINTSNQNRIVQGIELDNQDKILAYHLLRNHPGANGIEANFKTKAILDTVRIAAEEIIHPYRLDRPGQLRGVTWFAPIMLKLRDLDEFEDAELVRQKVAACFAGFIHDIEPPADVQSGKDDFDLEKLEPGIIEHLPPGKEITFGTPPSTSVSSYSTYVSAVLRAISAGLGVSYEALTGDLTQVNFSSGRMGWLEFQRNIDTWREHVMIARYCRGVFDWFKDGATLSGERTQDCYASWISPRREMIDPTKEIAAKSMAIRNGLETLSDAIRESGKDPKDHFKEIKADNDTLTSLGLILDSDPRNTNSIGSVQADNSNSVTN